MSNVLRKKTKSNNPPAIPASVLAHESPDCRRHGEHHHRTLISRMISFFSRNQYIRHYCSHLSGGYPDTVSNKAGHPAGA